MSDDIELAEQQITGFTHAAQGYSISQLASSMGLTSEEWKVLKSKCDYMREEDIQELDKYFA